MVITENYLEIATFAFVKRFWHIFAFYIIGLSILPCCDNAECDAIVQTQITQTQNHENHNHESEHCTPFCHCSCCGQQITFSTEFSSIPKLEKPSLIEASISIYDQHSISNYVANIWQPPKIS